MHRWSLRLLQSSAQSPFPCLFPITAFSVRWKLMCQHSIMYVEQRQSCCPIEIIDVFGWHGRCNDRNYTVVASGADRMKALSQLTVYWQDGNALSAPVTFGSFYPERRMTGGMIQTWWLRPGQDGWEYGLAGSVASLYWHVVVSQLMLRSSAGILVKSAVRRDEFRHQSARFQSVTSVI